MIRLKFKTVYWGATALGGLAALAAPHGAAAAEDAAADAATTPVLEMIVVTAQKRSQSLELVPDSVTALSGEQLVSQGAFSLADYYRSVPGLVVNQAGSGTTQLSIRGITASNFTGPTVGVYVDDTPIGTSASGDHASSLVPDLDPSAVAQVEVLRGPQGTLYGASSIGGLFKYVTVQPNLAETSGRVELDGVAVDHGGLGSVVRGAFNGPIVNDVFGITANAYYRWDPGYIDDKGAIDNPRTNQVLASQNRSDINSARVYGGRVAGLWQIDSDATLKLSALYQYRHGNGNGSEDYNSIAQQSTHGDLNQISSAFAGQNTVKLQVYNAAFNWDLHWANLLSSTSYAQNDYASLTDITGLVPPAPTSGFPPVGPPPFLFPNAGLSYLNPALSGPYFTGVALRFQTQKTTEEVRLTSPSNQTFEWQTGFFFTHERTTAAQNLALDNPVTGATYPVTGICAPPVASAVPPVPQCAAISYTAPPNAVFDESLVTSTYREYAGFADGTYHLTDAFSIQAGVRASSNRQTSAETSEGVLNVLSGGAYASATPLTEGTGSDVTYLVSPSYVLNNNLMVYGRVATGYRPGGINELIPGQAVPTTFHSDTTTNYEIGTKAGLLDGRMTLNVAAFRVDWKNILIQALNPNDDAYFANGKTARSQGVEVEAALKPVDRLLLRANAAYDEAKLTADIPLSEGVVGFKGDPIPAAPKWTASLSADYIVPLSQNWTATLGGDLQYVGSSYVDFYSYPTPGKATPLPPPRSTLEDYTVANFRVGLEHHDWKFNFLLKNLADKRAFMAEGVRHGTYALDVAGGKFVPDNATPIVPREFVLSVVKLF